MAIDVASSEGSEEAATSVSPNFGDSLPMDAPKGRKTIFRPSTSSFDPVTVERFGLLFAITMWYLIGVGAIVTTKILLTDWNIPPLLLTFQQLVAASTLLRLVIMFLPGGAQPLPWEGDEDESRDNSSSFLQKLGHIWEKHSDFILAGIFNALDFLSSNSAFSRSAASFVETIKSSDPITTTAVALAWNVDRLARSEGVALSLLIVGVLLSTWGNAQSESHHNASAAAEEHSLEESISGVTIVTIANFCFAFRAMFQKRYRSTAGDEKLNDVNLLCRMQQTGAAVLFIPVLIGCSDFVLRAIDSLSYDAKLSYVGLSVFNASCYAVYK